MAKKKKKSAFRRAIKKIFDFGIFILIVLVLTFIISNYVFSRIVIENTSMEKTLSPGDSILIDKISYRFHDPERFDIIVFRKNGSNEDLIKRVIGLPYEEVQIIAGRIYINGEEIEDYKDLSPIEDPGKAFSPIKLSEGEYFVIGDNREVSIDSRSDEVGLVTNTRIIGRCFMRIFPIGKFRLFLK